MKEKFLELGGKEWKKGNIHRIYITADIFNQIMETRFSDSRNKFFFDCKKNALMRSYRGKKPSIEKTY